MYRSQIFSQPKQSSFRGQALMFSFGLHSSVNIATLDAIIRKSTVRSVTMNTRNELWLLTPTQLLIQGQWWSNRSTHLLHIAQCLLRGVRRTSHSGHISHGCTFESTSMNSNSGRMNPGSFIVATAKEIARTIDKDAKENAKNVVFWSILNNMFEETWTYLEWWRIFVLVL